MAVAIEGEVRRILGVTRSDGRTRAQQIVRAVLAAWRDWMECPDRGKYSRWARTRACMVFERLADRLPENLGGDEGVQFIFDDETIRICFDDELLVRCKKANELGFGQNNATQACLQFCECDLELPGLPGLQKVEILYSVNATGTAIESIVVQARDGDMRLWAYPLSLSDEGSGTSDNLTPFPTQPPPSYTPDDFVNPRPRHERELESDSDDNDDE